MCKLDRPRVDTVVTLEVIKNILKGKQYFCEYQPFICTKTNKVEAYEALSRFHYSNQYIAPDIIFHKCHNDIELFFHLESKMKEYQFKHRIKEKTLFINFDPHILLYIKGINKIFKLFSEQQDFVIELVENSNMAVNIKKLVQIFEQYEYSFAVDDFFKENSMVSTYLLNNCEYLKLDKDILRELKRNDSFIYIVDGIVKFAHSLNKKVVLEGVETKEDIEIAKQRNIDLMQGFYFKDQFIIRKG